MGGSRIEQYINGDVIDRECTRKHRNSFWYVTHGGEVHLALADLHHQLLSRIDRLGPCTLVMWIRLVLVLEAIIDIVPRLSTNVTTAIVGVAWGCVRLGSLLLSVANWKFPEGLLCEGLIVQHQVEDCWDKLGMFFFRKQNFLLVPQPEAKPACLFLSLWAFFIASF
jgi:hypothetical protein